jgi:heterodisulfide reductase subunit A
VKSEANITPKSTPRIGVFLCRCGGEIMDSLDFDSLGKGVRTLPGVVFVTSEAYPCSRSGIAVIEGAIKEHRLERIVVAGCTPRLHGKLFSDACERAGLNRWLIDVANIREHCSRVHSERGEATEKALVLIAAGVKKVNLSEPRESIRVTPRNSVLVIGGGLSGLSVAAELLSLGHEVTLVEKADALGGMLLRLNRLYPHAGTAAEMIKNKLSGIEEKAEILMQTGVRSLTGGPGQYRVSLESDGKSEERDFGAIVVATGMECPGADRLTDVLARDGKARSTRLKKASPKKVSSKKASPFLNNASVYGGRVLTQMDIEEEQPGLALKKARSTAFVNVVPNKLGHSASRLYSLVGLKNANLLKEADSTIELTFIFDDVPADFEREFSRARDAGVRFIRCDGKSSLEFTKNGLRLKKGRERPVEIRTEVVVLPGLCVPAETSEELSAMLRIPADAHGFYVEPHVKLRPGDFVERGVFVVGGCHSPATVFECTSQATVAASRASRFLSGEIERLPLVSRIDEKVCRGCGRCAEECRWNAIEMEALENALRLARVDETLCTGCGVCSTVCICGAPSLAPVSQNQVREMVSTLAG